MWFIKKIKRMASKSIVIKRYIVASANQSEYLISSSKMTKTDEADGGWTSESPMTVIRAVNVACGNGHPPYSNEIFSLINSLTYFNGQQLEIEYKIITVEQ